MNLKNFSIDEFSEDPIKYADEDLINNLDKLRDFIGKPIYPSPVKGALARFDGSKKSQHYAINRKSTAIDIFVDCSPFEAFIKILQSKLFNRVGIYFDTYYNNKNHVMFHVDLKDQNLIWLRDNYKYSYSYEKNFYKELLEKFNNYTI